MMPLSPSRLAPSAKLAQKKRNGTPAFAGVTSGFIAILRRNPVMPAQAGISFNFFDLLHKSGSAYALLALTLALSACASHAPSTRPPQSATVKPHYKVGEPYEIKGERYYPKEDFSYNETGIASWYGSDFHNGMTANGEIFNKDELTAAHKTLPLPSLARVTNLDNGKSIVVRVNDRGPFSGARIIDMSQRSAQLLGFEKAGTAKVRVQVLADESKAIADAMRRYGTDRQIVTASASSPEEAQQGLVATSPYAANERSGIMPAGVESITLEPIRTTPAVHQQLLETRPVAEVVQMPVNPANNSLFVQAGAFTVLDNAKRLQQKLAQKGHPATLSDIIVNGTVFHRVRVGPIASVAQADSLLNQVRSTGVENARTVVD
ncbi:MAG: septal ring lytic transglycosylase RlpA family protein [Bdellovibrionales bacterium]